MMFPTRKDWEQSSKIVTLPSKQSSEVPSTSTVWNVGTQAFAFTASIFPRCVLSGDTGAIRLRLPIGVSAKRIPRKWIMPLVSFLNPVKEPSG